MLLAHLLVSVLWAQTHKLEITDTQVGTGDAVQAGDVVVVEYTGTLTSGKQFDSNVGKEPFAFQVGVGQVIKGWDQGVVGMKIGGTRKLVIPFKLAYGERALPPSDRGDVKAGSVIPAKSDLKFTVKLLKIEPRVTITTLRKGTGLDVKVGDTVTVDYRGTFEDGKEFDSSYKRGQPFPFVFGGRGMIPGFLQGIFGMRLGEKRRIVVPPRLGYGPVGMPQVDTAYAKKGSIIPPNATLIFEIEMVRISPAPEEKN